MSQRAIKFRAVFDNKVVEYVKWENCNWMYSEDEVHWYYERKYAHTILLQYTGLKDKNGKEVYEGDVVEFSDKWEWYRGSYGIKMMFAEGQARQDLQDKYEMEPMERRVVEIPECYESLSKNDLTNYWEVIGNIYSNPELIKTV